MAKVQISAMLLLFATVLSCDSAFSFNHSTCIFFLYYPFPNCSEFTFIECSWRECPQRDPIDQIACQNVTSYSWDTCTRQCCDRFSNYSQDLDGLLQCQADIDRQFQPTTITQIIVGIVVAVILICGFVGICYKGCQKGWQQRGGKKRLDEDRQKCLQACCQEGCVLCCTCIVRLCCGICFKKQSVSLLSQNSE